MTIERVELQHGSGTGQAALLRQVVLPALAADHEGPFEDAAVVQSPGGRLAFTTDSFVVHPLEFPGGDIGKLAACGTINDLAMVGATPLFLSASLILEEGLETKLLRRILDSLAGVCRECGVRLVCGDTKVVERGKADGVYITTSGIGEVRAGLTLSSARARPGDRVLVSGPIGRHGVAIMAQRANLGFASHAVSDCAPLHEAAGALLAAAPGTRVMRDATRGGVAAVLNEIAADSGVTLLLDKADVPVDPVVEGACALLGMEPLQIANEGTFVAVVPAGECQKALEALRSTAAAVSAVSIGTALEKGRFPVLLRTEIGGTRPVEIPPGRLLPRIC